MKTKVMPFVLLALSAAACTPSSSGDPGRSREPRTTAAEYAADRIEKTDAEWRAALSPDVYHVMREKGTERAFTGKYYGEKRPGTYRCAACGLELFDAAAKYDSGTGWPSFFRPLSKASVQDEPDLSLGI